jgi:ssDNA-binding replication factor A large subunit
MDYINIEDLQTNLSNVNLIALVTIKSDPVILRDKRHAVATVEDHTGQVALNLWRGQVDQCKVGDLIRVTNAFVREGDSELQISTWSDIEVL